MKKLFVSVLVLIALIIPAASYSMFSRIGRSARTMANVMGCSVNSQRFLSRNTLGRPHNNAHYNTHASKQGPFNKLLLAVAAIPVAACAASEKEIVSTSERKTAKRIRISKLRSDIGRAKARIRVISDALKHYNSLIELIGERESMSVQRQAEALKMINYCQGRIEELLAESEKYESVIEVKQQEMWNLTPATCDHCQKQYSGDKESNFDRAARCHFRHVGQKEFKCTSCDKCFSVVSQAEAHQRHFKHIVRRRFLDDTKVG